MWTSTEQPVTVTDVILEVLAASPGTGAASQ